MNWTGTEEVCACARYEDCMKCWLFVFEAVVNVLEENLGSKTVLRQSNESEYEASEVCACISGTFLGKVVLRSEAGGKEKRGRSSFFRHHRKMLRFYLLKFLFVLTSSRCRMISWRRLNTVSDRTRNIVVGHLCLGVDFLKHGNR